MTSILDMVDTKYSISGAYAMQVLDMLDMRSIIDVDDFKYSISGYFPIKTLDMLDMKINLHRK